MILVLGAGGFVGGAVVRALYRRKIAHEAILREDGDLTWRAFDMVRDVRAPVVINCAARCGGIATAGALAADLLSDNLEITTSVFDACSRNNVKRLVQPIANCIYPARASTFRESELWDGPMHPSVEVYGFTRRAALLGAEAYRAQYGLDTLSVCLPNGYGPGDHFDDARGHALSTLVRRFVQAERDGAHDVVVWGTGDPIREWMYVDDMAEALVRGIDAPSTSGLVNVGTGAGVSIRMLAEEIARAVGFTGEIVFDASKPNGAPCKQLDPGRGDAVLGTWTKVGLAEGIARTVAWVREHPEVMT